MSDKIKISILEDGTIKVETDAISPAAHMSADGFLKHIQKLAGGNTQTEEKKGIKHTHEHGTLVHSH